MARTRRRISRREIKEDRFILWLFEISSEIDKHKRTLIAGIAVVILGIAGVYYWLNKQADDLVEASKLFAPGQTAMQQNRYDDAITIFERVVDGYGRTPLAIEATINLAKAYFNTEDYENARKHYQNFLDEYGNHNAIYKLTALSGLAACDEEEEKYAEAARQYLDLVDEDNKSYLAAGFLLDAARCYKAADQKKQARDLYLRVVENYGSTPYARDAQIALTAL